MYSVDTRSCDWLGSSGFYKRIPPVFLDKALMRIFVVGMPGCGNLGDDLISILLVQHITERWPDAEIGLLYGTYSNQFSYPANTNITFFHAPRRREWQLYFKRKISIQKFLKQTDLILIGGGGLFQDSHSLFNIHNWIKYTFEAKRKIPVWAVGTGFGPLNTYFSRWYLKKIMDRFSIIQVRDEGSKELIENFGYSANVSPDIVTGSDLNFTPFNNSLAKIKTKIGCSIRPWPGLNFNQIVNLIVSVCNKGEIKEIAFFAFEYSEPTNTTEFDLAYRLASEFVRRGFHTEILCYRKDSLDKFAEAFCSVSKALATRYHANILWQKLQVPVIPISYAPKIRRLYEEQGGFVLRIFDLKEGNNKKLFQSLPMKRKYRLPDKDVTSNSKLTLAKCYLVQAVDIVENIYGIMHGLGWRLWKTRYIEDKLKVCR